MPSEIAADVLIDEPLDGIASRADRLESSVPDEDAAATLEAAWRAERLPMPADRAFSDAFRGIVSRLKARGQPEDLGELDSAFDLIGLHVPPGGRAALELQAERDTERSVNVELLGFGYGDGRRITVALKDDIAERGTCMRIVQHVVLRLLRFAPTSEGQEPLVTTDVVRCAQRSLVAWPDCPFCRPAGEEPDPFRFEIDPGRSQDLRGYDAELSHAEDYKLEGEKEASIGVAFTAPGGVTVNSGFRFKQQISLSCSVSYRFPPGRYYTAYRARADTGSSLPYWHAG